MLVERAAEVGVHAGDVGDASGQLKHSLTTPAHGDRRTGLLDRLGQTFEPLDPIVLPREVERSRLEEPDDDPDRLLEALAPDPRGIEVDARGLVLGAHPPGPQTEL